MAVQISSKIRDRLAYAALVRLRREIGAAPVANDVTIDNVLFVDLTGNDGTAIKGDLNRPWRTIQAAANAALPGETVIVMPGDFAEAVVAPASGVRLVGQGILTATTSVTFSPTVDTPFLLSDMRVAGPVTIDGSAIPDAFATTFCLINRCNVSGALALTRLCECEIGDVSVDGGFTPSNSNFSLKRCQMDATTHTVDWSQPVPNGLSDARASHSDLGILVVNTQAKLQAEFCTMRSVELNTVEDGAGRFATLDARCCKAGGIAINANLLNPHDVLWFNAGSVDAGIASDGSAGGVRATAYVQNTAFGGMPIVAGNFIDLDIIGSTYRQSQLMNVGPGVNQGRIERTYHVIGGNVPPAPGGIIPIVPPFVTAIYAAPWDNQSGLPDADVIVSGKLNDGFTAAGYRPGSTGTPSLLTGTFALTLYK